VDRKAILEVPLGRIERREATLRINHLPDHIEHVVTVQAPNFDGVVGEDRAYFYLTSERLDVLSDAADVRVTAELQFRDCRLSDAQRLRDLRLRELPRSAELAGGTARAARVASSVPGVKSLRNALLIVPDS
jgi:hypothetical protein